MRAILIRLLGWILPLLFIVLAVHLLERVLWRLLYTPLYSVEFPATDCRLLPPSI